MFRRPIVRVLEESFLNGFVVHGAHRKIVCVLCVRGVLNKKFITSTVQTGVRPKRDLQ